MKARTAITLSSLAFVSVCFAASAWEKLSYKPKDGFVPDERTAVAIAVAIWTPIYGEKQIADQRPYKARLKDGIWTVQGSFSGKPGDFGGVAIAEIAKADGRVIAVVHEK